MKTKRTKYPYIISISFVILILIMVCIGISSAFADTENAPDDLGYIISTDGKTLLCCNGKSTTATIPVGIEIIAESAFRNNTDLVNVRINTQTKIIKQNAFSGCVNIKNIIIPTDSKLTEVGYMAFAHCETLREIALPATLESIGDFAFLACGQLSELSIPESVKSIGEYAFMSCVGISRFTIPQSVETIGRGAFNYCIKCTAIDTNNDNEAFSSQNGILYNKEKTELLRYPVAKSGKSFTIPKSVERVKECAFWDNRILTAIKLQSRSIVFEGFAINDLSENTILTKLQVPELTEEDAIDPFDPTAIYRYCPNLEVEEY